LVALVVGREHGNLAFGHAWVGVILADADILVGVVDIAEFAVDADGFDFALAAERAERPHELHADAPAARRNQPILMQVALLGSRLARDNRMHLAAPRLVEGNPHRHRALARLACEHARALWVGDVHQPSARGVNPKDAQATGVPLGRNGDIDALAPQRKPVGDIDIVRLVNPVDSL
jgi:hypothetical protein